MTHELAPSRGAAETGIRLKGEFDLETPTARSFRNERWDHLVVDHVRRI